jgi:hypothetical protein
MARPTKEQLHDRFRFRLWDDELKTYFHSNDDGSLQFDIEKVLDGLSVHEGEVLEQCTGLKDKNGRLIYEGDIIKENNELPTVVEYYAERGGFIPMAQGNGCGCCESGVVCIENGCTPFACIIGNIHENPELLEDK